MPDEAIHAVHDIRLSSLEKTRDDLWEMLEKTRDDLGSTFNDERARVEVNFMDLRDKLSGINSKLAAFGVVNTLILGWIAFKLTKGA